MKTLRTEPTMPGYCPLCGSTNVTITGQNLSRLSQAPTFSRCNRCEYSWSVGSFKPDMAMLWRSVKHARKMAKEYPHHDRLRDVDRAYRHWLILAYPETVLPYLPLA